MSSDNTTLLDQPREVDVVSIERELTTLWKKATDPTEDDSAAPVTRACSLNFVVVTESEQVVEALAETIAEVTVEHPSRTFLVVADRREATPSTSAWISARCSVPVPGGKQVCCEQINIVARGRDANKIPSIVTSLLVSDVPTVLLWKVKVDRSDDILISLLHIADRVLIDSSEESDPIKTLSMWGEFIGENTSGPAFGDLSWAHLNHWRSMIAQVFQSMDMRSHLGSLTGCVVEFSITKEPRHSGLAQSLLMVGWIVNRLGWTLVRPLMIVPDGGYSATLRVDERAISVRMLKHNVSGTSGGTIEAVRLVSSDGVTVNLQHAPEGNAVHLSISGVGTPREEMLLLNEQDEASLLARELEELNRNTMFEQSLACLLSLMKEPRDANAP